LALIGPRVRIGDRSQIGAHCVIEGATHIDADNTISPYVLIDGVISIGPDNQIGPKTVIQGVTRIGSGNRITGQASLGAVPQDVSYKGEPTELELGDHNQIREFVTINRGTVKGGGLTSIGSNCLLMACCHVAHDCRLEDGVHLANCALLAGHVAVDRGAKLSGNCVVHPFVSIGAYSYAGGMTRISRDVPPFMLVEGHSARVWKVNDEGLRRAGFVESDIEALQWAFKEIYRSGNPRRRTLEVLRSDPKASGPVLELIESLERIDRGVLGRYREGLREAFLRQGMERIRGEVASAR
jgi:UDP-N-acetylglucosamine acyltransferase